MNPFSEKNSVLLKGLGHKSEAEKYEAKAQLAEKRAGRQHRPELILKFRQEAQEARRSAAIERRQAIAWIQKSLKTDPVNAAVQRELADLLVSEGEGRQAKKHLLLAVTHERDPDGFKKTVALTQRIQDPEIGNGWDFVIDRLKKENRPEEASIVSKLGYGGPQYFTTATSPSSRLYQSLLRAGISREAIDGSRKGPSRARHIWNYVGEHFQEAPVRKALVSAGIPVDFLSKDVIGSKPKGAWFGEALAAHYSEKAAQTPNARKKEELLALAVHYRPGHSAEYVALGDHFFSHKNYAGSLKAYEAGISAGMTEGAYLGAGRCHVVMGELAKAHDVYVDYLRFDSRSVAARTARLEINLARFPGVPFLQGLIQNQAQYEIAQDRAMLRFLNPAADREELKSLSTDLDDRKAMALEKKAQEFLFLGNLAQSRPEDAEDLGEHYGNLAKDSYRALHDWLQKSPDPKAQELALFYLANSYAAEGNVEKAEQTYRAVVDTAAPRFVYGHQYIGDTDVEKGKHALERIIGKKEGEAMVARGRDLIEAGKRAGDTGQVEKGEELIREGEYRIRICHPYTEEPSPAVLEAAAKLKRLSDDKTRSFHLAALDFWEGIVDEQAKIQKSAAFEIPSIGGGKVKARFDEVLEKKLITDVRERLVTSEDHSLSLNEAIAATASKHPDAEVRNYAEQYLSPNDEVDGRPANVIGYLLAYAGSGFPPSEDVAQRLLGIGEANERKGQGQVAMGAYGFVKLFSEKAPRTKAEKLIRLASGHGSFLENVERAVDAMSPEEIARDVVLFGAIGKVGTVARIAVASRLTEAGAAGWKVWLYAHTAEVVAAGTGFFFYGIHQELQNGGDPDKVFSSGHLARRYGASLLMMGLTKFGGGAGTFAGENQVAQWGLTHAGSFLGMASSAYANRLLGLEEGSLADSAPLASASVFYLTYAAGGAVMGSPAPRAVEPVTASLRQPMEIQKRIGADVTKPVDVIIDVATRNHIRAVQDAFVESFPGTQDRSVNGKKLNEAVSVVKSDGVHICVRGAKSKAQWIEYLSQYAEAKATASPDVFEFSKDGVSFPVRVEVDTEVFAYDRVVSAENNKIQPGETIPVGDKAPPSFLKIPEVIDSTMIPVEPFRPGSTGETLVPKGDEPVAPDTVVLRPKGVIPIKAPEEMPVSAGSPVNENLGVVETHKRTPHDADISQKLSIPGQNSISTDNAAQTTPGGPEPIRKNPARLQAEEKGVAQESLAARQAAADPVEALQKPGISELPSPEMTLADWMRAKEVKDIEQFFQGETLRDPSLKGKTNLFRIDRGIEIEVLDAGSSHSAFQAAKDYFKQKGFQVRTSATTETDPNLLTLRATHPETGVELTVTIDIKPQTFAVDPAQQKAQRVANVMDDVYRNPALADSILSTSASDGNLIVKNRTTQDVAVALAEQRAEKLGYQVMKRVQGNTVILRLTNGQGADFEIRVMNVPFNFLGR